MCSLLKVLERINWLAFSSFAEATPVYWLMAPSCTFRASNLAWLWDCFFITSLSLTLFFCLPLPTFKDLCDNIEPTRRSQDLKNISGHWGQLISNLNSICNLNLLLLHDLMYSQVLSIRTWTFLGVSLILLPFSICCSFIPWHSPPQQKNGFLIDWIPKWLLGSSHPLCPSDLLKALQTSPLQRSGKGINQANPHSSVYIEPSGAEPRNREEKGEN